MIVTRRRVAGGRRAVTLIEVLVVLALLAGMLALALPIALRSIERNSFRAAVSATLASLDEARAHAQREGVMVELVVVGDGHRLRARALSPDGGDPTPISMIDAPLEVAITVANDEGDGLLALFLPDGSSPFSRVGTIRGADGAVATISVGAHLGRPTVAERVEDPDMEESASKEIPADTASSVAAPVERAQARGADRGRASDVKGLEAPSTGTATKP